MTDLGDQPRTLTRTGRHLPSLTGARALAAAAVFLAHVRWILPDTTVLTWHDRRLRLDLLLLQGGFGVNFFFILSGFVLAWSWRDEDRSRFYRRRLARIVPNHVVTWAVGIALAGIFVAFRSSIGAALLSLFLIQAWSPGAAHSANPVAWTLSCELFFYLVFPWVMSTLRRLTARSFPWAMVGALVPSTVVGFATSSVFLTSTFPPVRVGEFVLGALTAHGIKAGWIGWSPPLWVSTGTLALASALGAASDQRAPITLAMTIVLTAIVARLALGDIAGHPGVFHGWVLQAAGRRSFAFYLVHGFFIWAVIGETGQKMYGWGEAILVSIAALAVAVAGAEVLYRCIERPGERLLRPRSSPNNLP